MRLKKVVCFIVVVVVEDFVVVKAIVEFLGCVWWGLRSLFYAQPNYDIEVMLWLCYVMVGVVTISLNASPLYHRLNC